MPVAERAVSHEGVLIEYLTVPLDALTRYWNNGANGPPCGPENSMPICGVTTKEGEP
jgi:hypothetical protein